MRLPVLLAVLLAAPVAASDVALRVDADPPRSYAYRNAFGETEHYLVVVYRLTNTGEHPQRFPGVPVRVVGREGALNDGFRPLVQAAFCREHECARDSRSTAELQGARIAPGDAVAGLAVFPLRSVELPTRVEVRAGNGVPVEARKAEGSVWIPTVTAVAKPAASRLVAGAPRHETRNATAPPAAAEPEPREEAPRSWRVVHSGIRPPSGIGR